MTDIGKLFNVRNMYFKRGEKLRGMRYYIEESSLSKSTVYLAAWSWGGCAFLFAEIDIMGKI